MILKLTETKKWVLSATNCLTRIDDFLLCKDMCSEKVKYVEIEELVAVRCKMSCESSLAKLQVC
jgi:histone demethylase JARID1